MIFRVGFGSRGFFLLFPQKGIDNTSVCMYNIPVSKGTMKGAVTMTTNEKISRIEELKKLLMMSWQEAEELNKLRANLKVSDFFRWLMTVKKERRISPNGFYNIMGYTEAPRYDIAGFHAELEKAIENGYVTRYTVKRYGRYVTYLELTKKGEKIIFK